MWNDALYSGDLIRGISPQIIFIPPLLMAGLRPWTGAALFIIGLYVDPCCLTTVYRPNHCSAHISSAFQYLTVMLVAIWKNRVYRLTIDSIDRRVRHVHQRCSRSQYKIQRQSSYWSNRIRSLSALHCIWVSAWAYKSLLQRDWASIDCFVED